LYCYQFCVIVLLPVLCYCTVTSSMLLHCYQFCVIVLLPVLYYCTVTSSILLHCYQSCVIARLQVLYYCTVTSYVLLHCYQFCVIVLLLFSNHNHRCLKTIMDMVIMFNATFNSISDHLKHSLNSLLNHYCRHLDDIWTVDTWTIYEL
jgi:hypothetical protein